MSIEGVRLLGSRYRLTAQIGRGGMGEVWRGVDADGCARAFKLLLPHFAQDPEVVRRFLAERQLLLSVRDPNVVGVHDLVIEGTTLGIVMDLVEGPDLRRYLMEQGTLSSGIACRIGAQVASGLAAIHAMRIVHRDVKPENVLLEFRDGVPSAKLTDFGVAKVLEETSSPAPTVVAGTPCYMAPEVINGQVPTTQSDLYSLGIVLYEMLCGVAPFAGMASGPMMQAHLTLDPGRPGGIDDRVWQLISELVRKSAGARPFDAGTVAARLWDLAGLTAGVAALPRSARPPAAVPAAQSAVLVAETQLVPGFSSFAPAPGWSGGQGAPAHVSTMPTIQGQPGFSGQPGVYTPVGAWPTPLIGSSPVTGASYLASGMQLTPMPVTYLATPAKNRTPVLVGVIVGLLIVLAGVIGYLTLVGSPPTEEDSAAHEPAAVTSEPTQEASAPPTAPPSTSPPPQTEAPAPAWPPQDTTPCPGTDAVVVNSVTSCQFAFNVAEAVARNGVGTVQAYSPVTEQNYTMTCSAVEASIITCTGGNNAQVWIRR